jgi:hypothetical protein
VLRSSTTAAAYRSASYSNSITRATSAAAALQGNYTIQGTGLSLFALGRASFIAGRSSESENFLQQISNPKGAIAVLPASETINPQAARSSNQIIPVLELELGAEYAIDLARSLPAYRAT